MSKVTRPDQTPPRMSTPLQNAPAFEPFAPSGGGGSSTVIPVLEGRTVRNIVVPPGGFAGFAQQTAATQAMFQRAGRKGGKRSAAKRRKTSKKKAVRRVKRKTPRKSSRRLVKGSAAAKAHMAKIRRKRKR